MIEHFGVLEFMKKKQTLLAISILLFASSCTNSSDTSQTPEQILQANANEVNDSQAPLIKIPMLAHLSTGGFKFKTDAYVVFKFECPDCPEGSQCKPCMGDNIIVSEINEEVKDYNDLNSSRIILFLNDAGQLELHKKYRFLVNFDTVETDPSGNTAYKGRLVNFTNLK